MGSIATGGPFRRSSLTDSVSFARTHNLIQWVHLQDVVEVVYEPTGSMEETAQLTDTVAKDTSRVLVEGLNVEDAVSAPDLWATEQTLMFAG